MAVTPDCPGKYHVALDGVGFMLDDSDGNPGITHQSIRTQREQQGGSNANIGEVTVNPEGFWRRSIDSWGHGAGQSYYDRSVSDPQRFRRSHGVDVFSDPHKATLLHTMSRKYTPTTSQVSLKYGNGLLILRDGDVVKKLSASDDLWVPVTVTGMVTGGGGSVVNGVATLGDSAYIAMGTAGLYRTQLDLSSGSSVFSSSTVEKVWQAKGRLLCVNTLRSKIYNPTAAGVLPAALMTLPSSGLEFVDVAEGPNHIYMLVSSGEGLGPSRAVIYRTAIQPDGTALSVPVSAFETASPERGVALYGFAGFIFLITSVSLESTTGKLRVGSADTDGNLTFGASIPINMQRFNAMGGNDRFLWYGSSSNETGGQTSAELGRLDLTAFTGPLTPAYTNDLIAPFISGFVRQDVSGLVVLPDSRVIAAVDNVGVFMESATDYVTTGYVDSGLLGIDLADLKTPVSIDVEAATPSTTTIVEAVSVDRGATFTTVGTRNTANTDAELPITGIAASRQFELRTTLTGPGTATPTLYRHTLKVEPGVSQGNYIILRLRLFENEIGFGNQSISRASVAAARAQIEAWQAARTVIVLQEGSTNYNVTVRDIEWQSESAAQPTADGEFQGVMTARCKVVSNA